MHASPRLRFMQSLVMVIAAILSTAGVSCRGPAAPGEISFTSSEWTEEGLTGRRFQTLRCNLISTLRDRELEDSLPVFVERMVDHFESMLPVEGRRSAPLTVYVFATRAEWLHFTQRRFAHRFAVYSRIRRGGYTEGEVSALFYTDRAATFATTAHELWHQFINTRFDGGLPAWINEGMACYVEAVRFDGDRVVATPRHNVFRANSLCESVQADRLLSLAELLDTDVGEIMNLGDGHAVQTYYAQVWAIVSWLRHGDGGSNASAFDRMLRDIATGTFRTRVSANRLTAPSAGGSSFGRSALQTYFDGSLETLQRAYDAFLIRTCRF